MPEKPVEENKSNCPCVDYRGEVGENTYGSFLIFRTSGILSLQSGPVAQLGARFHGMEEVVGSIPTRSTNLYSHGFISI
jgi:hypothetical protein